MILVAPGVLGGRLWKYRRAVAHHWQKLLVVTWTLALSAVASAQSSPRGTALGGRTVLTGNTGVTMGRDGAAPFVNPATISMIQDRKLALSVNAYQYSRTWVPNWYQPGQVDPGSLAADPLRSPAITENAFASLPSTFCVFFTLQRVLGKETYQRYIRSVLGAPGRQKFGFCGATSERQSFGSSVGSLSEQSAVARTTVSHTVNRSFQRFSLGPSWSYQFTDSLTVGGSVHGTISRLKQSTTMVALSEQSGVAAQSIYSQSLSGRSVDLTTILGLTYRPQPLVLGLSVKLPSLNLFGSADASRLRSLNFAGSKQLETATGSFRAPPVPRFSVGAGLEFSRSMAELNFHLYPAWNNAIESEFDVTSNLSSGLETTSSQSFSESSDWTFAAGIGGERFLSDTFSLLGGVSADISIFDGLSVGNSAVNLVQELDNRVGFTFGLGTYGQGTELLLGTAFAYEWGEVAAPNVFTAPSQLEAVEQSGLNVLLVLAGSVSWSNLERVVRSLDNNPNP